MGTLKFLIALASCLAGLAGMAQAAEPKAVFAHLMTFTLNDWTTQMNAAKAAGIDAFALNMANNDSTNDAQVPLAFSAAQQKGFKLFFSLDYAGNSAWAKATVKSMITNYGSKTEYFKRGSQPLVSTFEGVGSAGDWNEVKRATKCFFMPELVVLGAYPAVSLANGVANGLFSWDAWPKGDQEMTTYSDPSYHDALGGKPYMMPVSTWFYTNLPGYSKN